MANKKDSIGNDKSQFDNLKNVTIREVKGFTVIENHKPIKPLKQPRIDGGPNDPIPE